MEHIDKLTEELKMSSSRTGKMLKLLLELKKLQAGGKGNQKVLYSTPNAPFHYEEKSILVFLDDMTPYARAEWQKYKEKVYDYPSMTINELVEKLEKREDPLGSKGL
jgi:hypothetical protein